MGNNNSSSGDPVTFCKQVCLAILFLHCDALLDLVCQGLAGPWYARRERGAVGTRVSGSMVRELR